MTLQPGWRPPGSKKSKSCTTKITVRVIVRMIAIAIVLAIVRILMPMK